MKILIRNAQVVSPDSKHHGKKRDILIEKGIIRKIGNNLKIQGGETYSAKNLHVSPGWFDMQAFVPDPGHEYKEDLSSVRTAAMRGGFTGLALLPDTYPPRDSKAGIQYVLNKSRGSMVDLLPYGAISEGLQGENLTEMFDMKQAGAIAFTDGKKPVMSTNLQRLALLYAKDFNSLIISFPHDQSIAERGIANEGPAAMALGMTTMPPLAEELMVNRDLYLAQYAAAPIHFATLTVKKSLDLVREARQKGLRVSAGVAAHHLLLNEDALADFNSHAKVLPPFREQADVQALRKAVALGTLEVICSDHWPEDEDEKQKEFDLAAFGAVGLETAFAVANTALRKVASLEQIIAALSLNPRRILGLNIPSVEEKEEANLTLFDPGFEWKVDAAALHSRCKNSPIDGLSLTGKALGVINHGQSAWFAGA